MAGELERLLIRLEADTTALRRALAQADRDVGGFVSKTDRNVSAVERRFNGMKDAFNRAVAGFAIVQAVRSTADMADAYQRMENRLKVVAKSAGDFELTQRRLNEIAQSTYVDVSELSELYARYAFAMKDAGVTTNETLEFTEALAKAVVVSGASASEASGALRQLSQGLAAGALRGEELNSILEQLPIVADLIATKMGVTTGELKKMGEQGRITRDIVFQALIEGMAKLNASFEKTEPTISQSLTNMKNAFLELGEASGIFDILTKSAQGWAKIFKGTAAEIKTEAQSLGFMLNAGEKFQGNIRPPEVKPNTQDPWAASIIPPGYDEQLREFRSMWEEVREMQMLALDDLLDDKTETAAAKMQALTDAVREGSIAWGDFGKGVQQVNRLTERANDAMLSSTSQFLDEMFQGNKTAATASALINTYQGITKALSAYPPPYSYAMAAMQAAMGFAQVRAIQSTSKSSKGGGAAPAASAPVAAAGGGEQQTSTLFVRGIGPSDLFTGDSVASLAEHLLEYQRNGGKVVL